MINNNLLQYLEGYLTNRRKNLFTKVLSERTRHFTVVLEDIYQQHNSSAVLRTCDIFGIQDVYTIENMYISNISRYVAKGSQKWLSINRFKSETNNTKLCLDTLRSNGYKIIGTTPHHNNCTLADFDISQKSAFVFGAEKNGISDYTKENADGFLKIPMVGFTESLNVSVAAAIILQNITTRLKNTDINWQLSEKEKANLYFNWVEKSVKNIDEIKKHYFNKNGIN